MDFPKSVPNVGLVGGRFVDENIGTGQPGSLIPAVWGNSVTLEMLSVLAAAGIVPDELKTNQLAEAISKIVASGTTWASITGKPTTRSGYGITDVYTRQETDQQINYRAIRDGITTIGLANNDPKLPYVRRESDNVIYYLQPSLGYAPVQQGTGVGQLPGYPVKIGWSGSSLKATVNDLDLGNLWCSSNFDPSTKANWGTKLSDYRITDAFTKTEVNAALAQKWDISTYPPAQYIRLGQSIPAGSNLRCGSGGSGPIANISSGTGAMEFHNDGVAAASAVVMFSRQGSFAAYLGLDTDNQFKVGGWSMGNNAYVLWHAGNFNPSSVTVPSGAVVPFARNTPPSGYIKANGATLLIANYPDLFAAIGTTFGGNGTTTFLAPDLRAEVIRGFDDGRGIDTGRVFGTAQTDSLQGHNHVSYYSAIAFSGTGGNSYAVFTSGGGNNTSGLTDSVRNPISDGSSGSVRTASETRSRNVALLYCIKI